MDRAAWLGIGFGLAIGLTYGWLQARELRRRAQANPMKQSLVGPVVRLTALLITLLMVVTLTEANKYWLTGSLAVAYTAPLFWTLKTTVLRKK